MASAKAQKTPRVGRDSPAYLLRLPAQLREELRREAEITDRSMNTVILRRIQGSYKTEKLTTYAKEPAVSDYYSLNETERTLFALLKKLSAERQLALISLLK